MSHLFYDHLVVREEIDIVLDDFDLDRAEKEELITIIDTTLSHHVLNVILNFLPKDKHSEFIAGFRDRPGDKKHLAYLKIHAHPEIEAEIKKQAAKLKADILDQIRKSKKRKK